MILKLKNKIILFFSNFLIFSLNAQDITLNKAEGLINENMDVLKINENIDTDCVLCEYIYYATILIVFLVIISLIISFKKQIRRLEK